MSDADPVDVRLRPYADGDLWIQVRFLRDPAMTEHLGGPETEEQVRKRHASYLAMIDPVEGAMFVIEAGPDRAPAGSVGNWEHREDDGSVAWETGWFVLPESNAICRKVGMRLLRASEFEYPKGHWMTCNDWVIDPPAADGS
jgi:hypothetical protein